MISGKRHCLQIFQMCFFGALPQVKVHIVKWRKTSLWKPWGTSKEFYSGVPFSNSDLNCFLSQCVWLQLVGEKQFAKKIFPSSFIFLFNLWKHIFRLFFSTIHPTWFHTCKEKFMSLTKLRKKKKKKKHFDTWQKKMILKMFSLGSHKKKLVFSDGKKNKEFNFPGRCFSLHQFSSPTHRRENYLHHTKKTDPQKIHLIHFLSLI